jgi:hypothetical protein
VEGVAGVLWGMVALLAANLLLLLIPLGRTSLGRERK